MVPASELLFENSNSFLLSSPLSAQGDKVLDAGHKVRTPAFPTVRLHSLPQGPRLQPLRGADLWKPLVRGDASATVIG